MFARVKESIISAYLYPPQIYRLNMEEIWYYI
jgi:hypothetical protein